MGSLYVMKQSIRIKHHLEVSRPAESKEKGEMIGNYRPVLFFLLKFGHWVMEWGETMVN